MNSKILIILGAVWAVRGSLGPDSGSMPLADLPDGYGVAVGGHVIQPLTQISGHYLEFAITEDSFDQTIDPKTRVNEFTSSWGLPPLGEDFFANVRDAFSRPEVTQLIFAQISNPSGVILSSFLGRPIRSSQMFIDQNGRGLVLKLGENYWEESPILTLTFIKDSDFDFYLTFQDFYSAIYHLSDYTISEKKFDAIRDALTASQDSVHLNFDLWKAPLSAPFLEADILKQNIENDINYYEFWSPLDQIWAKFTWEVSLFSASGILADDDGAQLELTFSRTKIEGIIIFQIKTTRVTDAPVQNAAEKLHAILRRLYIDSVSLSTLHDHFALVNSQPKGTPIQLEVAEAQSHANAGQLLI